MYYACMHSLYQFSPLENVPCITAQASIYGHAFGSLEVKVHRQCLMQVICVFAIPPAMTS